MAQDLLFPGNILSLHRAAVDKLAGRATGTPPCSTWSWPPGGNSGALPWGPEKVEGAKNTLIQLGRLPSDAAVLPPVPQKLEDDRPPEYTSQDIAQALQDRKGFRDLVPAVEQCWGRSSPPSDLKILYTLYDFLALPPGGAAHPSPAGAWSRPRPRAPAGSPPSPRSAGEAYKWQKAGIDTLEAADAHLRRLTRLNQRGTELIQLLFGESRAPVAKEAEYLDQWIQKGFPDDLLPPGPGPDHLPSAELQVELHERHPQPLAGQGPDHRGGGGGLRPLPPPRLRQTPAAAGPAP